MNIIIGVCNTSHPTQKALLFTFSSSDGWPNEGLPFPYNEEAPTEDKAAVLDSLVEYPDHTVTGYPGEALGSRSTGRTLADRQLR